MRHFCRGGLPVRAGDRVYVCRKPTLETVTLLLELFGPGLARLYLETREEGADVDAALGRFLEAFAAESLAAAAVLATCVEGAGPEAQLIAELSASRELILECASTALSQLDVPAVLAELPLEEMFERAKVDAEADVAEPSGLGDDELTPVQIGRASCRERVLRLV